MKNETSHLLIENYTKEQNDNPNKFKESILFRNIDIKMDIYNTNLEKDIKRLPGNLRFIKKYLYLEFLPKIDKLIDELEKIKKTSNYDEKIIQIKPLNITKTVCITCCDLFENHNIKHMRSNKILYGTLNGNIIIYDFEINKVLNEKFLGMKSRIDILTTSTIKFYDSLISRMVINIRGDPNITVLSYNHTYNTFNNECVISLKDTYANFTADSNTISLNTIPCYIKLSKDTFFMSVIDYLGGVRIYKFNEIPQSPAIQDTRNQKKDSALGFNFMMGKNNLEKKLNPFDSGIGLSNNLANTNVNNSNQNIQITATLIGYYKIKDNENYTILSLNNKSNNIENVNNIGNKNDKNIKTNNSNNDKKIADQKYNPNKKGANDLLYETQYGLNNPSEGCYNVKPLIDESNLDLTPLIKFNKNHPDIIYIQKKLIIDEKLYGGFSSCIVTTGIYLGFNGSTQFKYISLYPYLTDNMKNVFKVTKSKGAGVLSQEESMSIASSMQKKEKEYINFIKTKLDPIISTVNSNNSSNNLLNNPITGQIIPNIASNNKDLRQNNLASYQSQMPNNYTNLGILSIQNPIYSENTKNEFNFNTLVNITHMCGQKQINHKNNLIAIGMIDGSVLIWDTELHCDKFLFQDNKNEILSMSIDLNYLTTASKDGQIYIFELLKGEIVFNCYHNPYKNFPVFHVNR